MRCLLLVLSLAAALSQVSRVQAEEALFADSFTTGLSERWQAVGLAEHDFRVRDGALEMRVQPGPLSAETPRLQVELPFTSADTAIASVEAAFLDDSASQGIFAGLSLLKNGSPEFTVKKEWRKEGLVYSPGRLLTAGASETEPAPRFAFTAANPKLGPLRIIVRNHYAYSQVGPSNTGKYLNFFHSAIQQTAESRGFALIAAGAPQGREIWVRFDNLRVVK